ncbi:ricin-type beta-trefoil lectin domain protein [Streptomyces sp. NPDC051546]|uniref:ricin-type beta-trefoil lectin domain protein n=1 Tax=Streptomyces sp. NPDC051546 TaxID=3365655 RepID=UPI0037B390E9
MADFFASAAAASASSFAHFDSDAWTQLTAVYNTDTTLIALYVNGTLAATGRHAAANSPAPSGPLVLGRYKVSGQSDYFGSGLKGGVANLAVYSYGAPLTAPGTASAMSLQAKATHCLDNDYGRSVDGNKIQTWDCNMLGGGDAQKFEFRPDGSLRSQGKCLDAAYAGTANGTLLWLYTCNGSPGQQFLPSSDGTIFHPKSGRCLDTSNMNAGTQVYLWDCNASNPQRWNIPALNTAPLPVPLW